MEINVFENVDNYISSIMAAEDDVLKHVTKRIDEEGIPNMSISPTQGKLLQVLANMCNAKRILELGTLAGYSTIWMGRALPKNGKLITIEYDEHYASVAQDNIEYAGLNDIVEIKRGNALNILSQMERENMEPFDMIFIDADKPPYVEYFQYALKLARPGSIIVADNVIRNGKILDKNSDDEKVKGVQRFNKWLGECEDVTAIILQTVGVKEYDGMAIAVVKQQML